MEKLSKEFFGARTGDIIIIKGSEIPYRYIKVKGNVYLHYKGKNLHVNGTLKSKFTLVDDDNVKYVVEQHYIPNSPKASCSYDLKYFEKVFDLNSVE